MQCRNEQFASGSLWPVEAAQRALARAVSAEMHSGFRALCQRMPMNCRAHNREVKLVPALEADIGRVLSIWSECRQARTESGDWLFGRFSIADAMYVPVALRFHSYSVNLPEVARNYVESVLQDPDVSDWMRAGAAECEIIEADDSRVLNERTDRFLIGDTWVELPVMGIFELTDGKISGWRDYFDMNQFTSQMPG